MKKYRWSNFVLPKEDKSIKDFDAVRSMKKIPLSKGYDEDANRDRRDYKSEQEGHRPDAH